jgi:hypothetical protein
MVLGTSPGSSGWVSVSQGLRNQEREGDLENIRILIRYTPPPGNEALHSLTQSGDYSMRVDLRAGDEAVFAQYDSFRVDSAAENYRLHLEGYHGTAGEGGPRKEDGMRSVEWPSPLFPTPYQGIL